MGQTSLHDALKRWYSKPGDQLEAWVDGYLIDIVRRELLIEIQTRSFSSIKDKVKDLLHNHRIRVVHPLVVNKWIVRVNAQGHPVSRRKSTRKGRTEDLFRELVYMPDVWRSPNLSLEVLFIDAEDVLIDDGKGSWRRKYWSIHDKHLLNIVDQRVYREPTDFLGFLSNNLPAQFTTNHIAKTSELNLNLARKMAYTLRKMGVIEDIGKRGRATLYAISKTMDER
jgi:hypothetical protein